ncbi:MAG: DUF6929 family protein, partial [Bacteroidota bacterium]
MIAESSAKLSFIRTIKLSDYPSGSAITFYNGKFYVTGDDATTIQVLDKNLDVDSFIPISVYPEKRIPKPIKPDYEGSALMTIDGKPTLTILGSASTSSRKKLLLVPLDRPQPQPAQFATDMFIRRLQTAGIREINLEGISLIGDHVVIANRGHLAYQENHLILTDPGFWLHQDTTPITICRPDVSAWVKGFTGLSDIDYLPDRDLMFFSFSTEETTNTYDDGAIGRSYVAWMSQPAGKLSAATCKPDGMLSLQTVSPFFAGQKIEGLCA